jgi:hypothetical protein
MRLSKPLLALILFVSAGAAAAQTARLTADEARAELFGVELAGVNETFGDEWSECIEPGGRTLYRRGGEVQEGRLEITSDGEACFTYRGDPYSSCFAVLREGANYRFDAFVTRVVRRGVTSCGSAADAYVRHGAAL